MFIGKNEVKEQSEKDGRISFKLADGVEGTATKRQFGAITSEEPKEIDELTIMIAKHDADVVDVLNTIASCDLTYNEARFVLERAEISLTEMMEQSLCKVVEDAFGSKLLKMNMVNDLPLRELNDKIKK